MLNKATVKKAIAPLEEGFVSDGIKLEVGEIEGNSVTIRLLVTPEACRECMMPLPHLEKLFQQCLQSEEIQDVQVRVVVDESSSATS